jgi:hypothetical protein
MAAKDPWPTGEDDTGLDEPAHRQLGRHNRKTAAVQAAEQLHCRTGPSRAISKSTPERILARWCRTD